MHPHLVPRGTCSSGSAFRWPAWRTRTARSASGTIRDVGARSDCKAHEVDNLYVVDGSFFPSSGAVNPALTIMANALRVGDHLLERLGARRPRRRRWWHERRAPSIVFGRGACSIPPLPAPACAARAADVRRRGRGRQCRHDRVRHGPRGRVLHVRAGLREGVGRRAVRAASTSC